MNKGLKKSVAFLTVAAMAMQFSACSLLGGIDEEAVSSAADKFASTLLSLKYSKIEKLCTEIDDDYQELLDVNSRSHTPEELTIIDAITDSISYEVDEDSIEGDKKSASCDIIFTVVDYESVLNDEDAMATLDDCLAALNSADKNEITITAEFEKDDDSYLIDNFDDFADELFDYFDLEAEFIVIPEVTATWFFGGGANGNEYVNTNEIDLQIFFTNVEPSTPVYYEIFWDGNNSVVYTDEDTDAWVNVNDDGIPCDETGTFVAAGTYTITFYLADGTEIYSDSCTVTVEEYEGFTADPSIISSCFMSEDFEATIDQEYDFEGYTVPGYGWWDYNEGGVGSGIYSVNDTVSYSLHIRSDVADPQPVYMVYYFMGSTPDMNVIDSEQPAYYETISYTAYNDGNFYDLDYNGVNVPGYYLLIVASDAELTEIYLEAICAIEG